MSDEALVTVQTPVCPMCGKRATLTVSKEGWEKYDRGRGDFIQVAFPELTPDEREMLMTGLHPHCWDAMLGPPVD